MKKIFSAFCFAFLFFSALSAAPNMTAEINMDVRAATAAKAKADASDSAIRSGVIQVLSRWSDRAVVENLIMGADDAVLQNLVASTSISNEKTSKTAYTAKFSVTLDRAAVDKWYNDNNVPNFLAAAIGSDDRAAVYIEMPNGLNDWIQLNQAVRESGDSYDMVLKSIFKNSATASIRASQRRKFQNLCLSAGWHVSSRDGVVRISR
ncbi:MAG: hypothetical protein LBQ49_01975 [Rickettsiales bacterium]|jgi:hypothetical protein|nr:hypothetical protein [Rickettsiales bacterium]